MSYNDFKADPPYAEFIALLEKDFTLYRAHSVGQDFMYSWNRVDAKRLFKIIRDEESEYTRIDSTPSAEGGNGQSPIGRSLSTSDVDDLNVLERLQFKIPGPKRQGLKW